LPAKSPKKPRSSTKDLTETSEGGKQADPLAGIEDLVENLPEKPPKAEEEKVEEIIEDIDASSFDLSPEEETELSKAIEQEPETESSPEETAPEEAEPETGVGDEELTVDEATEETAPEEEASVADSQPEGEIPATDTPAEGAQPLETGEGTPPPIVSETPPTAEEAAEEQTPVEEKEVKFETEVSPIVKALDEKSFTKAQIEAALFVSDKPVSVEDLSIKLEIRKTLVTEMIKDLIMDYMDRTTSLEIVQVGDDAYTMQIRPEYTSKVKKFATGGLIPEGAMRTLTIIALKQPITKSLLVKLRGSGAYEHVKELEDRGLVKSERAGRTQNVTTTDQFADMFGLSREVKKLQLQLKAQLGVKEEDEKEDTTPPPPPPVPER